MSADILRVMQEVIRNKDLLENDLPVSIGFSASGKVIVRHSLDSTPFFFDTIDAALEHIKKYIGDDVKSLSNNIH